MTTETTPPNTRKFNLTGWIVSGLACAALYAFCAYAFGHYHAVSILSAVVLISATIAGKMTDAIIVAAGENPARRDTLYDILRTRLVPVFTILGIMLSALVLAARVQNADFVAPLIISTAVLAAILLFSPLVEIATRDEFNPTPLTDIIFTTIGNSFGWKKDVSILVGRALMMALTLASAINVALLPIVPLLGG